MTTFSALGVDPDIAEALEAVGITTPFPIQAMTLPLALGGNDIIGQAKTGTGKTLGFGIPLLQRIAARDGASSGDNGPSQPHALVVVPTRELAVQVAEDLAVASTRRGIRVLAVYGGRAYDPQVQALRKGVDVVVGTPGRLLDLAGQKHLDLSQVRGLVLDEADQMLDLGFLPDVERLISLTAPDRQTMLFSATLPGEIVTLGRRHLRQPTQIRAHDPENMSAVVDAVEQHVLRVHSLDKEEILGRLLQANGRGLSIIFCATKRSAKKITDSLQERGFAVAAVHGDLDQGAREQGLRAFRSGKVDVLVATDVAARGIDVEAVTHVINYTCPKDPQTYVHRIGRTARAGATGTAVTFVDWEDLHRWGTINKELSLGLDEPLETYSTSPHLHELLDIPDGITGSLPKAQRTRAGLSAETKEELGGPPPRDGDSPRGRGRESGGRGGRDGSRGSGGSGGRSTGRKEKAPVAQVAAQETPAAEVDAKPRRTRSRTRTRGGETVAAAGDAASASGEAAGPDSAGAAQPRRRRSRGRSGGGAAGESTGAEAPASADA